MPNLTMNFGSQMTVDLELYFNSLLLADLMYYKLIVFVSCGVHKMSYPYFFNVFFAAPEAPSSENKDLFN